jgi:hypothetical protein
VNENIEDLRAILFETIRAVRDGKTTIEQAKVISTLAGNMTDTMRVEVDYIRAVPGGESAFLEPTRVSKVEHIEAPAQRPANGVAAVVRHVMGR